MAAAALTWSTQEMQGMVPLRGLPTDTMWYWFRLADPAFQGAVTAENAVTFLKRSGLSTKTLAWVWDSAAVRRQQTLCPLEFSFALRLVALLQQATQLRQALKPDVCETMVYSLVPPECPPPVFSGLAERTPAPDLSQTWSPSPSHSAAPAAAAHMFTPYHDAHNDQDTLQAVHAAVHAQLMLARAQGGSLEHTSSSPDLVPQRLHSHVPLKTHSNPELSQTWPLPGHSAVRPPLHTSKLKPVSVESAPEFFSATQEGLPVALHVRALPVHDRLKAAPLALLAGVAGALYAAPCGPHGASFRKWDHVETDGLALDKPPFAVVLETDAAYSVDIACDIPGVEHAQVGSTSCVYAHQPSNLLWTGYTEGYLQVRMKKEERHGGHRPGACAWQRLFAPGGKRRHGGGGVAWPAFRSSAVAALAVTYDGAVWVGSANGHLRVWHPPPADVLPDNMASTYLEVQRNGRWGGRVHLETSHVVASMGSLYVWSAGGPTVHIWCARTRALLRSFPEDVDEQWGEGEVGREKEKEKEKRSNPLRGMLGFAKRSVESIQSYANTIMDHKTLPHVRGMAAHRNGTMWVGYQDGRIEQYTADGRYIGLMMMSAAVRTLASVRTGLWVGLEDGTVHVLLPNPRSDAAAGGKLRFRRASLTLSADADILSASAGEVTQCAVCVAQWAAHRTAVVAIAQVGSRVFTLSSQGELYGWPTETGRTEGFGRATLAALHAGLGVYAKGRAVRIAAGTWNVNETRPRKGAFKAWLGGYAPHADLVCCGLQEMEMGTASVLSAGAKEIFARDAQEKGNDNAAWWCAEMLGALEEGSVRAGQGKGRSWYRVGMRQLSGMLVAVFARTELAPHIGDAQTAAVATGVLGVGANKGGVALRFLLFRRSVCVLCSHFAAHQAAVAKRNADYREIAGGLRFDTESGQEDPLPWLREPQPDDDATPGTTPGNSSRGVDPRASPARGTRMSVKVMASSPLESDATRFVEAAGLQRADVLLWLGDFNYRLNQVTYEEATTSVRLGREGLAALHHLDQLGQEQAKGTAMLGLQEGPLWFAPTYKFDKGSSCYDSSEKKRVPAWTDRILFRLRPPLRAAAMSALAMSPEQLAAPSDLVHQVDVSRCQDPKDAPSMYAGETGSADTAGDALDWTHHGAVVATASLKRYDSAHEVDDSDHKPVRALLHTQLMVVDAAARRRLHLNAEEAELRALQAGAPPLQLTVDSTTVHLASDGGGFELSCPHDQLRPLAFQIYLLDTFALQPLPLWLVATPTAGVIHPGGSATVGVTVEKGSLPSPPPSSTAVLCVRYSDYAACAQQVVEELHIHVHLWS